MVANFHPLEIISEGEDVTTSIFIGIEALGSHLATKRACSYRSQLPTGWDALPTFSCVFLEGHRGGQALSLSGRVIR